MTTHRLSRRQFGIRLFASSIGGAAAVAPPRSLVAEFTPRLAQTGLLRDAEMIHEVIALAASPGRVFDVLANSEQFTAMSKFSTVPNGAPARIAPEPGGEFSMFGNHIVGRNLELVRPKRVVQAWRVVDWEPGLYSVARFELAPDGSGTRLTFDHTGFPKGQGPHLVEGWSANYWAPMRKYLR